jgi:hypothetical protein
MKTNLALFITLALSSVAQAGTTDILNPPPVLTKGWEIVNGGNIGQSFKAVASDVTLGVYVADQETYSQQVSQVLKASCITSCTASVWDSLNNVVSPTLSLNVTVYEGEGLGGKIIYQSTSPITLDKPFNGLASVDLGAAGVFLTVGQQYTVTYTEISGSAHTYWQFLSTMDPTSNHGSYYSGWSYIKGIQQNPDSNIGDIAFQVIDNAVVSSTPATCQGTSAIASSLGISKLFMTLANGTKVAYSNVYGSQGTTKFTYNGGITAGTFPVGSVVTYVGIADASTICVPSSLTIDPAPVVVPVVPTCTNSQVLQGNQCVDPVVVTPSCTAPTVLDAATNSCVTPANVCGAIPADAQKVEGEAKITAVGANSITVGNAVVFFNDCTSHEKETEAKSFAIGQSVEYKGFKNESGITASKIKMQ